MIRIILCALATVALAQSALAGDASQNSESHRYNVQPQTTPIASPARAAVDGNGNLGALIAKHAAAYGVPEALIRRVIRRESGGNARAVSQGNYGLMQIKLGTARAMGYSGSAAGLLDADTNMTYAVKYLAGAYKAAGGNADGAVHNYAAGYYHSAKRSRGPWQAAPEMMNANAAGN